MKKTGLTERLLVVGWMWLSWMLQAVTTPVSGYRADGMPCFYDFQCIGYCDDDANVCAALVATGGACARVGQCASGRCREDVCQDKLPLNATCLDETDCQDGDFCGDETQTAAVAASGLPLYCQEKKLRNLDCSYHVECNSDRCDGNPSLCTFQVGLNQSCHEDNDCVAMRCKIGPRDNPRVVNPDYCSPRMENGDPCYIDDDCLSLRCEQKICEEPVVTTDECVDNNDCYSFNCDTTLSQCDVIATDGGGAAGGSGGIGEDFTDPTSGVATENNHFFNACFLSVLLLVTFRALPAW